MYMQVRTLCCGALAVVTNAIGWTGKRGWAGDNPSVVINGGWMSNEVHT